LYVICTKWPGAGVEIEGINLPGKVSMLGFSGAVNAAFAANKITLTPPAVTPATMPCEYAWVFKLENAVK